MHDLDNNSIQVIWNKKRIERVFSFQFLSMLVDKNYSGWTEDFNKTLKECFTILNFTMKFQRLFPSHGKKQLMESVVLS